MGYKARDVLHASLTVNILDDETVEVVESSGVELDSISVLAPGIFDFRLTDALSPTEENLGSMANYELNPDPLYRLGLPHCVFAPVPIDPNDFDPAARRFIVRDVDGGGVPGYPVRACVQWYQFNQGQEG